MALINNSETQKEISDSISRAFYAKKMIYSHELVYDLASVKREMNNAKLEKIKV